MYLYILALCWQNTNCRPDIIETKNAYSFRETRSRWILQCV